MKLIYQGKTKDVYENNEGQIVLKFKDNLTGKDGAFDPGANTVGLTIEGAGQSSLRLTTFFFQELQKKQIPTHFITSDIEAGTMTVKNATMFGNGLEVICRFRAVGSFYRRYGAYCEEGQHLDAFVEVTLKDDKREDPPISADALDMLGILSLEEYALLKKRTKEISELVKNILAKKALTLYDIKLEFGRDKQTGDIMLIDEISGGNMRVYKDHMPLSPFDIEKFLFT